MTLQAAIGREAFSAVTWRQGCPVLVDNLMSFNQMGVKKKKSCKWVSGHPVGLFDACAVQLCSGLGK